MKRDYESLKNEFTAWCEQFSQCDVDGGSIRPFALPLSECVTFMEGAGTDQPIPAIGARCEIMGVNCLVVRDDHD